MACATVDISLQLRHRPWSRLWSGVALGLFFTRPLKRWPVHAILLGFLSLADGFFRGEGARSMAACAAGATIGPLLGAALFRASESRHARLERVQMLAPLLIAILPSALISGGFIALSTPDLEIGGQLFERWLPWAAACALGALTIVPLLLTRWSRRYCIPCSTDCAWRRRPR